MLPEKFCDIKIDRKNLRDYQTPQMDITDWIRGKEIPKKSKVETLLFTLAHNPPRLGVMTLLRLSPIKIDYFLV